VNISTHHYYHIYCVGGIFLEFVFLTNSTISSTAGNTYVVWDLCYFCRHLSTYSRQLYIKYALFLTVQLLSISLSLCLFNFLSLPLSLPLSIYLSIYMYTPLLYTPLLYRYVCLFCLIVCALLLGLCFSVACCLSSPLRNFATGLVDTDQDNVRLYIRLTS
jgi:hypothetical protein